MLKAFAYARYSSDSQREESITAQFRAIHSYADAHGIEIVREYSDEEESARTDQRPAFLQMFGELPGSGIDVMLVHKQDRFSRSRKDSAIYKGMLARAHVRLILVDQPLDDSPESVIMEAMLEGMAEYYSRNLARETMKGLKENAYQCRHTGGLPPLGYDVVDGHYIINEEEAETVRALFSMYAGGNGYNRILNSLSGHFTKAGRPFGKNSLNAILRNEKYIGNFVFNRKSYSPDTGVRTNPEDAVIRVYGGIPAIIDAETWRLVQERISSNKRNAQGTAKRLYLLSGKLFCSKCKSAFVGKTYKGGRAAKYYSYYICGSVDRKTGCDMIRLSKDDVEGQVVDQIADLFSINAEESAKRIIAEAGVSAEPTDIKNARAELGKVERQIKGIVEAIKAGAFHQTMKEELDRLSAREQYLHDKIDSYKGDAPTVEELAAFIRKVADIRNVPDQDKKRIINSVVDKIWVYDNGDYSIDFRILGARSIAGPRNQNRTISLTEKNPYKKSYGFFFCVLA